MEPKIEVLKEKKLVGKRMQMSFADNKTGRLWASFMAARRTITNPVTTELISMQIYRPHFFDNVNPGELFEKWAAVEVADFDHVPDEMESFMLAEGQYAVFMYKGSSTDNRIFEYIFMTWLPGSAYVLDDRPHFEILGDKYKNADPDSEEEIWIPVKPKSTGTGNH